MLYDKHTLNVSFLSGKNKTFFRIRKKKEIKSSFEIVIICSWELTLHLLFILSSDYLTFLAELTMAIKCCFLHFPDRKKPLCYKCCVRNFAAKIWLKQNGGVWEYICENVVFFFIIVRNRSKFGPNLVTARKLFYFHFDCEWQSTPKSPKLAKSPINLTTVEINMQYIE